MDKLRKFVALSSTERLLLVRVAFLVGLVRVGTWLLPFRVVRGLSARLGRQAAGSRRRDVPNERLAWAVEAVGKRIPGGGNCLVQALSAQVLLDRRNRPAQLRIGVAKGPGGELQAHAWVESEGKLVIGGAGEEDLSRFVAFPEIVGRVTR
jgi:hypothetical protein